MQYMLGLGWRTYYAVHALCLLGVVVSGVKTRWLVLSKRGMG